MIFHYALSDIAPYINWLYFFHAWGFEPRYASVAQVHGCEACRATWLASFPMTERAKATEAMQLHKETMRLLHTLTNEGRQTHALVNLYACNADGDDIILLDDAGRQQARLAFLRQQQPTDHMPCLCLSDFVRPINDVGQRDTLGVFATAADTAIELLYPDDAFMHMLAQTLADRLAEATAEVLHLYVRKTLWGYAPDENLTIDDLHAERFTGIRPAVGYPSLPDQSLNFDIDDLLHMSQIGITLTESGAMLPHAAVSGLMMAHPQARYFAVGHIAEDQLNDYARRRQRTPAEMRKFLAHSISS